MAGINIAEIGSDYTYFIGQAIISREQGIESMVSGSTGQTELSRERLNDMEIIIPYQETLYKFNSITSSDFCFENTKSIRESYFERTPRFTTFKANK